MVRLETIASIKNNKIFIFICVCVHNVSKVEDGIEKMLQDVIFEIPEGDIANQGNSLVRIAKPLLGWMHVP